MLVCCQLVKLQTCLHQTGYCRGSTYSTPVALKGHDKILLPLKSGSPLLNTTDIVYAVTNHGVQEDVVKEQYKQSKAFFDLPEDVKIETEVRLCSYWPEHLASLPCELI